jgi:hypothetical protein
MGRRTAAIAIALAFVVALALSACSSGVPTQTTSIIEGNGILTADLSTDVTAKGVVLAAVVLVAGDVEKALTDGTVSDAEVALARKAIAAGNLDLWRQRAEADAAK